MSENPYYIFSPEEAMDELQIGRNAIYKLLESGALKGFRVGRNWKIPKKSIDKYIDEQINTEERKYTNQ